MDMETSKNSAQLAEGAKADLELVARILWHLAPNNMVREGDHDHYLATPFVVASNDPDFATGLIYGIEGMIPTFQGLAEFLAQTDYVLPHDDQKGSVQYGLPTDKSFFGVVQENKRLGAAFNRFMPVYAQKRPRWVDFSPCQERLLHGANTSKGPLLIDFGRGLRREIGAFHAKHPTAPGHLVLQSLPSTVKQVTVELVARDFFTPRPLEYRHARAYFLHLVLHDWPHHKCHAILSHLRDAMKPGYSKMLINEIVLPDAGAPLQQTSLDWTTMAREEPVASSQWNQILTAVGLKIMNIYSKDPTSESLVLAVLLAE
ncbi:hypothetical protein DV737_g2960, partial [Chaetothyriales sp. CBS 132003]